MTVKHTLFVVVVSLGYSLRDAQRDAVTLLGVAYGNWGVAYGTLGCRIRHIAVLRRASGGGGAGTERCGRRQHRATTESSRCAFLGF
eukprot:632253-Prorocentrum_minimum.AAC.3